MMEHPNMNGFNQFQFLNILFLGILLDEHQEDGFEHVNLQAKCSNGASWLK